MLTTLKMPKVGDAVDETVVKEIRVQRGAKIKAGPAAIAALLLTLDDQHLEA